MDFFGRQAHFSGAHRHQIGLRLRQIINQAWCKCQYRNWKSTADSFKAATFGKVSGAAATFQKNQASSRQ
jgi:hypothetical protein